MNISVYRCRATYLLVPPCFLPSMEAIATHGPARFRGTLRVDGPVADALMRAMEDKAYVTLALDHPMTNERTFPRALAAVGIGRDGMERRHAVVRQAAGAQGVLPLKVRRADRSGTDVDEGAPLAGHAQNMLLWVPRPVQHSN
jgi:hypothetical protein